MDLETIKHVSWIGDNFLRGDIRAVLLSFHGLNFIEKKEKISTEEVELAAQGVLIIFPYYGPWSWMNRQSRAFIDDLVEGVYACYNVPAHIPLITDGLSMGGHASLLYTRYAKRNVSGCMAISPVCDLKFHFHEREDLPKTIYHAFRGYHEDMDVLLEEHSPLHQVHAMPKIPYLVVHGKQDRAVSQTAHSDKLVQAMQNRKLDVNYFDVPEMYHCNPIGIKIIQKRIRFVLDISSNCLA